MLVVCFAGGTGGSGSRGGRGLESLRRGEGAGYFDKPADVGSSPTSGESGCSSVAEQRKTPVPVIPAAKSCAVAKAGVPSETGSGRKNAAH